MRTSSRRQNSSKTRSWYVWTRLWSWANCKRSQRWACSAIPRTVFPDLYIDALGCPTIISLRSFLRDHFELLQQQRFLPFNLLVLALVLSLLLAQLALSSRELFSHHADFPLKTFLHLFHLLHQGLLVAARLGSRTTRQFEELCVWS